MVQKIIYMMSFTFIFFTAAAQKMDKVSIYNPNANAAHDIDSVVAKAKKENKQVLIQVGGNWCVWCIRFHHFVDTTADLKAIVDKEYITYLLNYSKENTNEALMKKFHHPDRFGFPVFLVLNAEGELIHTQDSGYLEENKGYSKEKVKTFFNNWTVKAVAGDNK